MNIYLSESHDPYFNLATEEFFLKNSANDIFMIYTNEPAIIAGKHQNILAEMNSSFTFRNSIKIARRLSGGGTVYHDLDNINFSFIRTVIGTDMINYRKFATPVLVSLHQLGLNVQFSDRNDMIINDMKISGSAMHVYKNRVLAHGTILFNSNLEKLSGSLKSNAYKYTDKSIKSVRSKITNIKNFLSEHNSTDLINHLFNTIQIDNSENYLIHLNDNDKIIISKLVADKYFLYDWIYGYSPKYQFETSIDINGTTTLILLSVEKGIIKDVDIQSTSENNPSLILLCNYLYNKKHEIKNLISDAELIKIIYQIPDYSVEKFSIDFF
jgi:lipoate---protein ligase